MKLLFLLIFSSLFLFGGQSQIEKSALLWEVKSNDSKSISYVFGTMHLMDANLFLFPKKLEKTLLKADVLCMEIVSINPNLSPDALFMKDKSLSDLFSINQLDSIYNWAESNLLMKKEQFDENFKNAKPFLLMQFILQASLPTNSKSYEKEFEALADQKLTMKGLETVDQQLNLFDGLVDKDQVEMVMSALRNEEKSKKSFEEMQQIYLTQNLDDLYAFVKKETDSPIGNSRTFLEDRNLNWIPQMKELMKTQSVFFAVGAAHLAGPEGVIELLIKEGYQLTPIKL
jgi:uncharacterized protein YbaP (TraB family)